METKEDLTVRTYTSDMRRLKILNEMMRSGRSEIRDIMSKYSSMDYSDDIIEMWIYYDEIVCPLIEDMTGVTFDEIMSQSRIKEFVTARKWLVAVMYDNHVGPSAAARFIGGRDHATVINLHRKHKDHMQVDPVYRKAFNEFKQRLEGQ